MVLGILPKNRLTDPSEGGTLPHSHGRNIMGMFPVTVGITRHCSSSE